MTSSGYMSLENRIVQLESKLNAVSQRTRKEIIWKKQLEDWILQNFNYDLRLQVELKLLESEGGGSSSHDLDNVTNNSSNFVLRGQTRITKENTSTTNSRNSYNNTYSGNNDPQIQNNYNSSLSQMFPNISISTLPAPTGRQVPTGQGYQGHTGLGMTHQYNNSQVLQVPRVNSGYTYKRRRGVNRSYNTPIIVSTSSMAPKQKRKQTLNHNNFSSNPPELIVLDDEEESTTSTNSSSISTPQYTNTSQTTNTINTSQTQAPSAAPVAVGGPLPSVGAGTSASGSSSSNPPTDKVVINADASQPYISEQLQQNNNFVADSSFCGDVELGESENSTGYNDLSFMTMSLIQLENQYAANNYISRNEGSLLFNVDKILLDYDPNLYTEIVHTKQLMSELPLPIRKRINSTMCHFLIQVYGEQVPREAKEAMAQSLFLEYPGISKESWFQKLPNKSAVGLIEHRISFLRRTMRDQRKLLEENPSLLLA